MTTALTHSTTTNYSYSYQHIQGVMLLNLNKIACDLNLSHADYRLMGTLIGLWNKSKNMAFPTIEYLSKYCQMSKSTVLKSLKALTEKGLLIVVRASGKRNNYHINQILFNTEVSTHAKPSTRTSWSTPHVNKQIKNRTNKEQTFYQSIILLNDDVTHQNSNEDLKEISKQLESWSFTGAKFVIKKHGVEKIKNLVEIIKSKNPDNPGAYLRSLLNLPGDNTPKNIFKPLKIDLNEGLNLTKEILTINEPRLSKKEIINQLISENKLEEANTLKKLWRLSI